VSGPPGNLKCNAGHDDGEPLREAVAERIADIDRRERLTGRIENTGLEELRSRLQNLSSHPDEAEPNG
jgi:hypothetical protein